MYISMHIYIYIYTYMYIWDSDFLEEPWILAVQTRAPDLTTILFLCPEALSKRSQGQHAGCVLQGLYVREGVRVRDATASS